MLCEVGSYVRSAGRGTWIPALPVTAQENNRLDNIPHSRTKLNKRVLNEREEDRTEASNPSHERFPAVSRRRLPVSSPSPSKAAVAKEAARLGRRQWKGESNLAAEKRRHALCGDRLRKSLVSAGYRARLVWNSFRSPVCLCGELGGQHCFGVHYGPGNRSAHAYRWLTLRGRDLTDLHCSKPDQQICLCGELGRQHCFGVRD
jgi:hypothetical protein